MARTEHLLIYKASYDLCYLEELVHGFSRYRKYTLGADLRDGPRRAPWPSGPGPPAAPNSRAGLGRLSRSTSVGP